MKVELKPLSSLALERKRCLTMFPRCCCVISLFFLAVPAVVQAQFSYTVNNGAVTITGYSGPGGAVVIPGTIDGYAVTVIGVEAFANSTNLTSIAIANAVSTIGGAAFYGCTNLATVVLSNSVTSIGDEAFYDCTSLTNFVIPVSVTNIGEEAFTGCASLANFSVAGGNPSFTGVNGVLYDAGQNTILDYPEARTNSTYAFPQTEFGISIVTGIGPYAFAYCTNLTAIFIPFSVNNVGEFAFSECTGLTSVTMTNVYSPPPSGQRVGVTNVDVGAFAFCSSLTNVSIAVTNAATIIGDLAFAFCTNLTSVYLEGNAPPDVGTVFYGDSHVTVYYVPLTTGWGATFDGVATAVTPTPTSDFEYTTNNGSITITSLTVYNYNPPSVIAIPGTINGYPVTSIGPQVFSVAGNRLGNVFIPASITNMDEAFVYSDVTNVVFANGITSIPEGALEGCDYLTTSVTIPESVTSIGEDAFAGCSLASFSVPDSVTSIGDYAFGFCNHLTDIVISSNVTDIGYGPFEYCTSLTNISVDNANSAYASTNGILFDKAYDSLIQYPVGLTNSAYAIPNSVTNIEGYTFAGSTHLASVTIPNSVTIIGEDAFNSCIGLAGITLPSSVTNIGEFAFQFCASLKSVYFQGNAPPDNGTVFANCPVTVYYLPGTTGWGATFGDAPTESWIPQATAFSTAGNQFGFDITWASGRTVVVEACTNLANPVWIPLSTNMLSGSGMASFSDPQGTNFPSRYYRFSAP